MRELEVRDAATLGERAKLRGEAEHFRERDEGANDLDTDHIEGHCDGCGGEVTDATLELDVATERLAFRGWNDGFDGNEIFGNAVPRGKFAVRKRFICKSLAEEIAPTDNINLAGVV